MAESNIKIKASVNEMDKKLRNSGSEYYFIKHYRESKYYKGNDDEPIVFEVDIRHNEIGKRSIERKQPYTFATLEQILAAKVAEYEKECKDLEFNEEIGY